MNDTIQMLVFYYTEVYERFNFKRCVRIKIFCQLFFFFF